MSKDSEPPRELSSIPKLLARNAAEFGGQPAYREKEYGIWQTWTWSEVQTEIHNLARGLIDLGVAPGDHVAVIGRNRPHLYWSMVAIECAGAVPVPLYQDAVAEEMHYVLEHCAARFAIAGDQEQVDKVIEIQDRLPALEHILYLDPRGMRKYDHSRLHAYHNVQAVGRDKSDELTPELDRRMAELDADCTCVMLYTSGTTGRPKGVVLTFENLAAPGWEMGDSLPKLEMNRAMSYLPMAHITERTLITMASIYAPINIFFSGGLDTFVEDLAHTQPTSFVSVPRLWAKFQAQILSMVPDEQLQAMLDSDDGEAINGQTYVVIRNAGETGQLYGSVSARDITEVVGDQVKRNMVILETPIKALGLHDVKIKLHPEVTISITVNVARSEDEAERQAKGEDVIAAQMDADRADAEEAAMERAEIASEMFDDDGRQADAGDAPKGEEE